MGGYSRPDGSVEDRGESVRYRPGSGLGLSTEVMSLYYSEVPRSLLGPATARRGLGRDECLCNNMPRARGTWRSSLVASGGGGGEVPPTGWALGGRLSLSYVVEGRFSLSPSLCVFLGLLARRASRTFRGLPYKSGRRETLLWNHTRRTRNRERDLSGGYIRRKKLKSSNTGFIRIWLELSKALSVRVLQPSTAC